MQKAERGTRVNITDYENRRQCTMSNAAEFNSVKEYNNIALPVPKDL